VSLPSFSMWAMARTDTVSTTGGLRAVHSRLESYQKPNRGVSAYSRSVNRPAGRWLASVAAVAGLTPNQLTLLGGLCSATAVAVVAGPPPSLMSGVLAGLLLMLAFALDSADGQLARLRHAESRRGEWLDHMLDAATKMGLHLAVLYSWFRVGKSGWWLVAPLAFLVVSVLLFFAVTLGGLLRRLDGVTAENRPPATGFRDGRLRPLLQTPADHGAVCLVFLLWGLPSVFDIGYTVVLIAQTAFLGAYSLYWLKELS
jgi:phosphatidylglycerophosphate synthase